MSLRLADFDFDLDPARIALRPAEPRDAARLMVQETGGFLDRRIADLPALLAPGDLLVVNDSRVLAARLKGKRGLAAIEATLTRPLAPGRWQAMARPAKRLRLGDHVEFAGGLTGEILAKEEGGWVELGFAISDGELLAHLERFGEMPLPPYIATRRPADLKDRLDYQTVYAASDGSVAAPTAGLHFTEELLSRLKSQGISTVEVTLHVGAGTFLPVKAERIEDHKMHAEWGRVTAEAAAKINQARRVVAIGTTAFRLMEAAASPEGDIRPFVGETDIFITPGRRILSADLLLTNFHLPRSTLLMLVAAFAGMETTRRGYAHALANDYRFFSYGDASLWSREMR